LACLKAFSSKKIFSCTMFPFYYFFCST
jgi:hypothetical protein